MMYLYFCSQFLDIYCNIPFKILTLFTSKESKINTLYWKNVKECLCFCGIWHNKPLVSSNRIKWIYLTAKEIIGCHYCSSSLRGKFKICLSLRACAGYGRTSLLCASSCVKVAAFALLRLDGNTLLWRTQSHEHNLCVLNCANYLCCSIAHVSQLLRKCVPHATTFCAYAPVHLRELSMSWDRAIAYFTQHSDSARKSFVVVSYLKTQCHSVSSRLFSSLPLPSFISSISFPPFFLSLLLPSPSLFRTTRLYNSHIATQPYSTPSSHLLLFLH